MMIISHEHLLPNSSHWAEEMWVIAISNHREWYLLSICCSKNIKVALLLYLIFCSGYFICLFLWCINAIREFCMEQAQLIAVVNTQWNYFLLTDFIPESRIPIVDNFLILFVTLLYGFPMSICVNSTTSLQKIKIHQNDSLKKSSPSTLLLKSKVFSFVYAQFIPSLYFTYNPPPHLHKLENFPLWFWEGWGY